MKPNQPQGTLDPRPRTRACCRDVLETGSVVDGIAQIRSIRCHVSGFDNNQPTYPTGAETTGAWSSLAMTWISTTVITYRRYSVVVQAKRKKMNKNTAATHHNTEQ